MAVAEAGPLTNSGGHDGGSINGARMLLLLLLLLKSSEKSSEKSEKSSEKSEKSSEKALKSLPRKPRKSRGNRCTVPFWCPHTLGFFKRAFLRQRSPLCSARVAAARAGLSSSFFMLHHRKRSAPAPACWLASAPLPACPGPQTGAPQPGGPAPGARGATRPAPPCAARPCRRRRP